MTRRLAILAALVSRLEEIKTANGFETEAGFTVSLGERIDLGPDDPPQAIAVVVQSDDVRHTGENVSSFMVIEFQAIARADINEPWIAAEQLLGDIKRAIELDDRALGGLVPGRIKRGGTRVVPREPGSTTVGIGITYVAGYQEAWGRP